MEAFERAESPQQLLSGAAPQKAGLWPKAALDKVDERTMVVHEFLTGVKQFFELHGNHLHLFGVFKLLIQRFCFKEEAGVNTLENFFQFLRPAQELPDQFKFIGRQVLIAAARFRQHFFIG